MGTPSGSEPFDQPRTPERAVWYQRIQRELGPVATVVRPGADEVIISALKATTEQVMGLPKPHPVNGNTDPLGVDSERFRMRTADYNKEQTEAFDRYQLDMDTAWAAYQKAMTEANRTYEQAITAAARHYDIGRDADERY